MIPRFYEESIDYLKIGQSIVAYPMVCFCDINMHLLASHVDFYGKYGLVFSKEWGRRKGIQPIHYINPESPLCNDFSFAFKKAFEQEEDSASSDYLLSHMVYMKPLSGKMHRGDSEVERVFTDEREWRYIPASISKTDIPCVIPEDKLFIILHNVIITDAASSFNVEDFRVMEVSFASVGECVIVCASTISQKVWGKTKNGNCRLKG